MPELISAPTRIAVPGGKVGVRGAHGRSADWSEPFQTPEFGEVTLVLKGSVHVGHDRGVLVVEAGQAVRTVAGERIRYSAGPEGADYVAVCLPAFSPKAAHRDDD